MTNRPTSARCRRWCGRGRQRHGRTIGRGRRAPSLANELAPDMVRVNSVHPGAVDNDMLHNQALYHQLLPDHPGDITREEIEPVFRRLNALPVPWVESVDISNAVLFLGSDDARYITGASLPVDAGQFVK